MKKIYYLSTCSTCKKIMKHLPITEDVVLQDVKKDPISVQQLEELRKCTDSYQSLLNRRAQLYKERNLKEQFLTEEQCKNLILEHYTFLKRPIVVTQDKIYIADEIKQLL